MSLLDDFNSICEAQDNSPEMKLRRYVQKDKYPLMFSMDEFCRKFSTHNISKDVMFARLDPNRVYLVARDACADWVTQKLTEPLAAKFVYLIGTAEDGMMHMSHEEYILYLKYHREQWDNVDDSTRRIEACVSDLVLYGKPTKNYNMPGWNRQTWYMEERRGFYIDEDFTFAGCDHREQWDMDKRRGFYIDEDFTFAGCEIF